MITYFDTSTGVAIKSSNDIGGLVYGIGVAEFYSGKIQNFKVIATTKDPDLAKDLAKTIIEHEKKRKVN